MQQPEKRIKEPRKYQLEALDRALKENTILYLDTGAGKTYVAVLLLEHLSHRLVSCQEKRLAIFLAPTVHLVIQQARVLSTHTELKVGVYYGGKGVDTWSTSQWQVEVDSHQVMVMTPQVFFDALNTSALKMEMVEILIFDECHHAQKRHAYALIMKLHYHIPLVSKPKIFGMTASPIIDKGSDTSGKCRLRVENLENILDSKLYTLSDGDRAELEGLVPTPTHFVEEYERSSYDFEAIRKQLSGLLEKYTELNTIACEYFCDETLKQKFKEKVKKAITTAHAAIECCLQELGLVGACIAVDILKSEAVDNLSTGTTSLQNEKRSYKDRFLEKVSSILRPLLPDTLLPPLTDLQGAERQGLITSKLWCLTRVLMKHSAAEHFRCIVFVERVVSCIVLAKLISLFGVLHKVIRADYITGVNSKHCMKTPEQQQETLDSFVQGKISLLVATSVAEEGLDVQQCSSVIRFDLSDTLRSYIQSRGRARRSGSQYTWLLESKNILQKEQLLLMIEGEKLMKEEVVSRADMDFERQAPVDDDLDVFRVPSGACRSTEDSVSFIYQYCARLPGDRYYDPRPQFSYSETIGECVCTVTFPPNAPIRTVEGPPRRSKELSRKGACLQAIRRLYDIRAIRPDTLCPDVDTAEEEEIMTGKSPSKEGTKKWKERHTSLKPAAFSGSWDSGKVHLQQYAMSFRCSEEPEAYAAFALLMKGVLEENFDMELYPKAGESIHVKLSNCGQVELDVNQLHAAKACQEFLLNAAYNRLGSSSHCEASPYWHESHFYLLLPMTTPGNTIDWINVTKTAEAFKLFSQQVLIQRQCSSQSMTQTASGLEDMSGIVDTIVVTIHRGELFFITGVLAHLTGSSLFPTEQQKITYLDYFRNKYGRELKFPWQSLLEAKQGHAFRNYLCPSFENEPSEQGEGRRRSNTGLVELPPELCLPLGFKSAVLRSLRFIPSVMTRLTSQLCARELSFRLAETAPKITTGQALEALTSKKCRESFSYEGLEILGDSFLKYAVSRRLFLVYHNAHQGQLTSRRSQAICNATLSRLSKKHNFPAYIRDEYFEPSYWIAPGLHILQTMLCRHGDAEATSTEEDLPAERTCIEGHRWIRSKVTADVVEALIGAYVTVGLPAALTFMTALGIEVDVEHLSARFSHEAVPQNLAELEDKLKYQFQNKTLLLEAITHPSQPYSNFCYQRLEFLGDSALDFLISKHLFSSHPGLSPGLLTDLRSAAVNNGCFARVAVKHGLHRYLRHNSEALDKDVTSFVQALELNSGLSLFGFDGSAGPKVLADLLESIAGAILVDAHFDLDKLWDTVQPLLSPIITPDELVYDPVRELTELCQKEGKLTLEWGPFSLKQGLSTADVKVDIIDKEPLVETGEEKKKQVAKKIAAHKMLARLEGCGYRHPKLMNRSRGHDA